MENPKKQLLDKIKAANNILVTVSTNPSADQLAACIGLSLFLTKAGKHASAVFSGDVPSTIEFLKPEETLEQNTDSLRDFIIALDKSKADKLRYKVEDKVVKIFITPYRTSIGQDDLEFSQGDFNVDVVLALGVHEQQDLDQAVTAHGRILHDAAIISVNNTPNSNLGGINWQDEQASSLSELAAVLVRDYDKKLLDEQIATALLTGIVAETDRFSNEKTTPRTMSVSADLMAAGANQQLVASKLEEAEQPHDDWHDSSDAAAAPAGDQQPADTPPPPQKRDDGELDIEHEGEEQPGSENTSHEEAERELPAPQVSENDDEAGLPMFVEPELPKIKPDANHTYLGNDNGSQPPAMSPNNPFGSGIMSQPPAFGGSLTANSKAEDLDPAVDPLSGNSPASQQSASMPILGRDRGNASAPPAFQLPPEPLKPFDDASAPSPVTPPPTMPLDVPPAPAPSPVHIDEQGNLNTTPPSVPASPPPPAPAPGTGPFDVPEPVETAPAPAIDDNRTLTDIEQSVHSRHVADPSSESSPDIDSARDAVINALNEGVAPPPDPVAALNSQPLGGPLHPPMPPDPQTGQIHIDAEGNIQPTVAPLPPQPLHEPAPNPQSPADTPLDMPLPPALNLPPAPATSVASPAVNSSAPPPVPPPMLPPFPQP